MLHDYISCQCVFCALALTNPLTVLATLQRMEENTALYIARQWLRHLRASAEWAGAIAGTFQRVLPEPEAIADDDRLAVLAEDAIYVITGDAETEDVTKLQVECVHVSAQRVRPSLSETHDSTDFGRPQTTYVWRLELDGISTPLDFKASEPLIHGRESDNPALAFWWRVAEAAGWTKPD
jgi:hypothetical protein